MKVIKKFKRLWLRLRIAYRIVFKEKHGLVVVLNKDQLINIITESKVDGDIQIAYFGMMEHQTMQVVKICAEAISDVDIICNKAEFDVMVEEKFNK